MLFACLFNCQNKSDEINERVLEKGKKIYPHFFPLLKSFKEKLLLFKLYRLNGLKRDNEFEADTVNLSDVKNRRSRKIVFTESGHKMELCLGRDVCLKCKHRLK